MYESCKTVVRCCRCDRGVQGGGGSASRIGSDPLLRQDKQELEPDKQQLTPATGQDLDEERRDKQGQDQSRRRHRPTQRREQEQKHRQHQPARRQEQDQNVYRQQESATEQEQGADQRLEQDKQQPTMPRGEISRRVPT
ncbi:hypothetical protein Q8A73_018819 [Channa argus]|nr:hypothetical protein Q8A73_018819 [Channa argus]